jgi:hypothetical protein
LASPAFWRIDWARARLDRAASLAALVTEPDDPDGGMALAHHRADTLFLAWNVCARVRTVMENAEPDAPSLTYLVGRAMEAWADAPNREVMDLWDAQVVGRMTVGELRAALKEWRLLRA